MSNFIPARLGAENNATGTWDQDFKLFLKVFGGEVMLAFERQNVALDKFMVRTIAQGKTASFPRFGKSSGASYHQPGQELPGKAMNAAEAVIHIDGLLVDHHFVPKIDELMSHYDLRSPIATEMGRSLANQMDRHILQKVVQAAQQGPIVTGLQGGTIINSATSNTDPDALVQAIVDASVALDEKDVPEEDRVVFVKPSTYALLAGSSKIQNVELNSNEGNGGLRSGKVAMVYGIPVFKTNNLPTTQITTGTTDAGVADRHLVDARNTVALVAHKSAVGTVKLLDLNTDVWEEKRHRGWTLLAEYAVGHGVLRPEAAVQIRTATPI